MEPVTAAIAAALGLAWPIARLAFWIKDRRAAAKKKRELDAIEIEKAKRAARQK